MERYPKWMMFKSLASESREVHKYIVVEEIQGKTDNDNPK
jgi:hypothetical protein